MYEFPLQLVDDILQNYHIGHVLLLGFVFAAAGGFAVNRSTKVLGLQFVLFGLIFVLTPSTQMPTSFLYLGIALVVVGPVVFVASDD